MPERIAALEEEQARLKEEAASPEFYKTGADHIRAVLARIDVVHAELDAALARWVELEAIANG
jgi:ATP-binding cassette subfamily F protein uup